MKTKTNTSGTPVPEKLTSGDRVVSMMTGNATFSSLDVQVGAFNGVNDTLRDRYVAAQATRAAAEEATVLLQEAVAAWELAFGNLAASVQAVTAGNTALILTSGFEVRNDPQPIGPLDAPQNLEAQTNGYEGRVKLRWATVRGADNYEVQKAPDPLVPAEWTTVETLPGTRVTLEGLPSVTRQWFRVRANGAAGPSPWSEPAVKTVP